MKKTKNKNPFFKISLAIALVAFLVAPQIVHAQATDLNVAVSAQEVEAGQSITISVSSGGTALPAGAPSGEPYRLTVYRCGSPGGSCTTTIRGENDTRELSILVSPGTFEEGVNEILAEISYTVGSGSDAVTVEIQGRQQFTVLPSQATGPTISVGQTNQTFIAGQVNRTFTIATQNFTPTEFTIDCGDGGVIDHPEPTATAFICMYSPVAEGAPAQQKCVNVSATYSGGTVVAAPLCSELAGDDSRSETAVIGQQSIEGIAASIFVVVNTIIGIILALLAAVYQFLMYFLILPLINAMVSLDVTNINDFVNTGWGIIRNIANLIFLLVLIVIGLSMVLRVQSYGNKRLIGMLLIMALLVNFSMTIGIAIIEVADAFTNTFLGDDRYQVTQTIYDRFKAINGGGVGVEFSVQSFRALSSGTNLVTDQAQVLASGLFGLFLQVATLFVFLYFAAILLLRFAAIWILLVLSPFAYAFFVLPQTQRFAGMWWSKFLGWVFILPIMSFFLFIIAQVPEFPVGSIPATGDNAALADFLRNNMQYVIILTFLWAAIYVSKMGALSGSQVMVGKMGAALGAGLGVASGGAARGSAWIARKSGTRAAQVKGDGVRAGIKRQLWRLGAAGGAAGTLVNNDVRKSALEEFKKKQAAKLDLAKSYGADIGAGVAMKKGDNVATFQKRQVLAAEKRIKDNGEDRDPAKLQEGLKKAMDSKNAINFEAYLGAIAANKLLSPTLQKLGHKQDVEGLQKLVSENEKGLGLTPDASKNLRASISTAAAKVHQTEYIGAEKENASEARDFQRTIIESMSQNDMAKLSAKAFTDHLDTVMPNFTDQRSANNVPVSTVAEIVNDKAKLSEAFAENRDGMLHMLEKLASLENTQLEKVLDKTFSKKASFTDWSGLGAEIAKSVPLNSIDPDDFKKLSSRLGAAGAAGGTAGGGGTTGGAGSSTGGGTPPPPGGGPTP